MEAPDCHLVMSVARLLMMLLLRPTEFWIQNLTLEGALADLFLHLSDELKPRHGKEVEGEGDVGILFRGKHKPFASEIRF